MERNEGTESIRTLSGINFLVGVWLIISPFILSYATTAARWDQVIFGIVVAFFSLVRFAAPRALWSSWINGLSGIWMIIAPFILNYSKSSAYWNEIIFGIVIAILAFWNTSLHVTHGRHHPAM